MSLFCSSVAKSNYSDRRIKETKFEKFAKTQQPVQLIRRGKKIVSKRMIRIWNVCSTVDNN